MKKGCLPASLSGERSSPLADAVCSKRPHCLALSPFADFRLTKTSGPSDKSPQSRDGTKDLGMTQAGKALVTTKQSSEPGKPRAAAKVFAGVAFICKAASETSHG